MFMMQSTTILARHSVFETNSSSCHSLAVLKGAAKLWQELCQVKLDDDGKSYVELVLPTYLYR